MADSMQDKVAHIKNLLLHCVVRCYVHRDGKSFFKYFATVREKKLFSAPSQRNCATLGSLQSHFWPKVVPILVDIAGCRSPKVDHIEAEWSAKNRKRTQTLRNTCGSVWLQKYCYA